MLHVHQQTEQALRSGSSDSFEARFLSATTSLRRSWHCSKMVPTSKSHVISKVAYAVVPGFQDSLQAWAALGPDKSRGPNEVFRVKRPAGRAACLQNVHFTCLINLAAGATTATVQSPYHADFCPILVTLGATDKHSKRVSQSVPVAVLTFWIASYRPR